MDALVLATLLFNTTGYRRHHGGHGTGLLPAEPPAPAPVGGCGSRTCAARPIAPQPAAARREEAELAHAA